MIYMYHMWPAMWKRTTCYNLSKRGTSSSSHNIKNGRWLI